MWDESNLQGLCRKPCHAAKTRRERIEDGIETIKGHDDDGIPWARYKELGMTIPKQVIEAWVNRPKRPKPKPRW